jgi:hypothetical protein
MLTTKKMSKHLVYLVTLRDKLLCLGMIMQMLELPHLLILIALELGHASYLVCKGNLIRSSKGKKDDYLQVHLQLYMPLIISHMW